jgi:YD repeat-containing protein
MRSMLISAGMDPVPRSALQRRVRHALDYDGSGALLEVLHEINAVQRFTHKTGERGRPVEYYRGTELLLSRGLGEQVLEKFM